MAQNIKGIGKMIRLTEKEFYGILMEIDFKDNLKIKKPMDMDDIFIIME